MGDTYFGEFYQELRQTRGKRNYLAAKGYDYALKHLVPFLQSADFALVNLEATLTERPSPTEVEATDEPNRTSGTEPGAL